VIIIVFTCNIKYSDYQSGAELRSAINDFLQNRCNLPSLSKSEYEVTKKS
jgi:hypothetical protein